MARPCGTAEVVAPGGRMPLAVCVPDGKGPFPGVLVLMEAFGLNADIRSIAGRLADEAFSRSRPISTTERTSARSRTRPSIAPPIW